MYKRQLLKPAWIDNLPDELQKCSVSNLMEMIKDKVIVWAIETTERAINQLIILPINRKILMPMKRIKIEFGFGSSVRPFKHIPLLDPICWEHKPSVKEGRLKTCSDWYTAKNLAQLYGCSVDDQSLWKRCYYERVRHSHL